MMTFATEALCEEVLKNCPVKPLTWYLEGNLSGDKKAGFLSILHGRRHKATARIVLSQKIVERDLGASIYGLLSMCVSAH